jgi:hypothetical protein
VEIVLWLLAPVPGLAEVVDVSVLVLIPAIHLGTRKTEDAYRVIHNLSLRPAPGWVPAFTSDGLPGGGRRFSLDLIYGQLGLVKELHRTLTTEIR